MHGHFLVSECMVLLVISNLLSVAEFIILCMVRTGAASPELIKLIIGYFSELDVDKSGSLTLEELCNPVVKVTSLNEAKSQARRYSAVITGSRSGQKRASITKTNVGLTPIAEAV
jgi:hypothetical protein